MRSRSATSRRATVSRSASSVRSRSPTSASFRSRAAAAPTKNSPPGKDMVRRTRMKASGFVLGAVFAVGLPLTAVGQFGPPGPPPYTPAADAKDLKSVLFNWTWHMGMLRGVEEHELTVSLEYQGHGTIQVTGPRSPRTEYATNTTI